MELTASNVNDIFLDCLYDEGENQESANVVEGVSMKVGFNPIKLEKHKSDIIFMCDSISPDFFKSGGGGMTFLNMCEDKNGTQWADMHRTCDMLVCLSQAVGYGRFLMPRDMWTALPGGMPYIQFGE